MSRHAFLFLCGLSLSATLLSCGTSDPALPQASAAGTPHEKGVFVDPNAPAAAPAAAAQPQQLAATPVPDTTGFAQPMTAMTLDVPAGWVADGGVRWERNVECVGNMHGIAWSATSPDGRSAVSLLPKLAWQVATRGIVEMNPCPAAPMATVRAYLEAVVQNARPGARVLSYRDRPDMVAERAQALPPPRDGARGWYEAGEVLIGYPLQGVEMRESIVSAVFFSEMRDPMIGVSLTGSAETPLALRAPDGQLDFVLLERIRRSVRTDRGWGQQMLAASQRAMEAHNQRQQNSIRTWHQARMSEISMNGILERGRIRMDAINTVSAIHNAGVASTAATDGRIHAGNIDAIQEVQPWRDPSTGSQVDLSIHYQHAWQLDDGRQFLTNDPNFDPSRDLGIGGHALEPAR